ncbi:MAG: Threonine-tRNA ligase, partial [Candidatus Uhrbacteria bacterium GW2011_GWE2_46_68]
MTQDSLSLMRHSTAHVLAAAVSKLYPHVKLGVGPAVEDGFY